MLRNNFLVYSIFIIAVLLNSKIFAINLSTLEHSVRNSGVNSSHHLPETIDIKLIEEFLNSLNNQTNSNGFNDRLCFEQLLKIITAIQNTEFWALEFIDSWGKIPSGILWMNLMSLGNFDQCLNITKSFQNEPNEIDIKGQYCMANIAISKEYLMDKEKQLPKPRMVDAVKTDQFYFKLGLCVPRTCNATRLQSIIENQSNYSFGSTILSDKNCANNDPVNFETIDWIAIVIFSMLGIILLLSSIYDYVMDKLEKEKQQLFIAFSLLTNGRKLFNMKKQSSINTIDCLNGIRCLSIVWVVYGHTLLTTAFLANQNFKYVVLEWPKTLFSMFVQSATVSVDSFFLLSGLLVAWIMLKELDKNNGKINILMMYIHRYLRLTPLLIFMILFIVSVFRYLGKGPFWSTTIAMATPFCERNWWQTILYVQNYVNPNEMCLGQTWYLAVDTQLYILSPLILIPLWKWGMKFGWVLFLLMGGSIAFVFVTFMNKEYSLLMKDGVFNTDRQETIYYPTHARFSPWLIGILLGYILHKYRGRKISLPTSVVICGWLISLTAILAIIFGPYNVVKSGSTTLEGAIYESFSRVSWAIALSWIIFACTKGYGGIINEFLSLPFWIPFSRLTYAIYITHMIVEIIQVGNSKIGSHFSNFEMICKFYTDFSMTLVISTIAVLSFESPIIGLEKIIFKINRQNINNSTNIKEVITDEHAKSQKSSDRLNGGKPSSISQQKLCESSSDPEINYTGTFHYNSNVF